MISSLYWGVGRIIFINENVESDHIGDSLTNEQKLEIKNVSSEYKDLFNTNSMPIVFN